VLIRQNSSASRVRQIFAMVMCAGAGIFGQALDSNRLGLTSKHYWHSGELKVSVRGADVTSGRLLETAQALQGATGATGVHFFVDPGAAEAFRFMEPEPHPGDIEAATHYVAGYSRAGRETLTLTPFGFRGPENAVTLEGDPSRVVRCQYQLDGRCVLRLAPLSADLTELRGAVTLTGIATPKGTVSDARVVEVVAGSEAQRAKLRDLAERNLAFWQLDPGPRSAAVRIVYLVGPPAADRGALTRVDLDIEYPGPSTETNRRWHFRVLAAAVSR
jgi:hypothetical protein